MKLMPVIPAQAGIQAKKKSACVAHASTKNIFERIAGFPPARE
jgi:hypothetical protein